MKILICEGKHDRIFLRTIGESLGLECSVKDQLRDIQAILRRGCSRSNLDLVIFPDTNKDKIVSAILPRLLHDTIGRVNCTPCVLVDGDGERLGSLFETFLIGITSGLSSHQTSDISIDTSEDQLQISVSSTNDQRYSICVNFIIIPLSFEKDLVKESLIRFSSSFSRREKEELFSAKPHRAMVDIATKIGITKDELITMSARERWFETYDWFSTIIQKVS